VIGGDRVGGILAAGGSGIRAGVAKQWAVLGGETVLRRSARVLAASGVVDEIVAVVPAGDEPRGASELRGLPVPVRVVAGGAARADSVRAGFDALPGVDVVLVHDAARPFATPGLARAVAEAAAARGAALAAMPATDTVKRAEGDRVAATLDRRTLWLAQTPQAFRASLLRRAYAAAGAETAGATD
jgi:2-C-methyl-D-erythritol 4-phosphate cytidylyltransferase